MKDLWRIRSDTLYARPSNWLDAIWMRLRGWRPTHYSSGYWVKNSPKKGAERD